MDRNYKSREQDQPSSPPKIRRFLGGSNWGILIWLLLAILTTLWMAGVFRTGSSVVTPISYSAFRQQVEAGNVGQVTVTGQQISGQLREPAEKMIEEDGTVTYTDFVTYLPSFGDDELLPLLERENVEIEARPERGISWVSVALNLLPLALTMGLFYFLFSRMRAGGQSIMSFGRSQAKRYQRRQEQTTFDDVAGAQGAKTELQEIIGFLKDPAHFQRLGGEMPKGVLLVGPPGTGKTLLARAVAGEADVPFFSITGSEFMEMFVGVGASRVRNLFDEAKNAAPSIVFIDELDSIGRRRGAGLGGGHDEREQTLNQLLSELDGFEPNESVIVMAATNRPDILDSALLRPGRFDRQIIVDLPTMQDRLEILRIHTRDKPLAEDVDLERVARGTPGFSGADLENLLNEAALLAARKDKEAVESEDIEQARDKVLMGLERENLALTDEECRMLAYHEAGHAVIAAILPDADPIHKVTIVPRGQAMGVTQQLPERDKYIYSREYMLDRLAVMMGGRAAERLILGTSTSGAADDLKQATRLARKMVVDWGMSDRLGHLAWSGEQEEVFLGQEIARRRDYSDMTAREIDEEVKSIVDSAYERAVSTLEAHRGELKRVADALAEKEELSGDEVLKLVGIQGEEIEAEQ